MRRRDRKVVFGRRMLKQEVARRRRGAEEKLNVEIENRGANEAHKMVMLNELTSRWRYKGGVVNQM